MLVDEIRLNELRELGGDVFVSALWDEFFKAAAEKVPLLHAAFARGDFNDFADLAHALKSASGNVGAVGFWRVCADLEKNHSRDLLARLDSVYAETITYGASLKAA